MQDQQLELCRRAQPQERRQLWSVALLLRSAFSTDRSPTVLQCSAALGVRGSTHHLHALLLHRRHAGAAAAHKRLLLLHGRPSGRCALLSRHLWIQQGRLVQAKRRGKPRTLAVSARAQAVAAVAAGGSRRRGGTARSVMAVLYSQMSISRHIQKIGSGKGRGARELACGLTTLPGCCLLSQSASYLLLLRDCRRRTPTESGPCSAVRHTPGALLDSDSTCTQFPKPLEIQTRGLQGSCMCTRFALPPPRWRRRRCGVLVCLYVEQSVQPAAACI